MDVFLVRSLIALAVVLLVWLFMAAGVRRALSRIYRFLASTSSLKLAIGLVGLLGIVNLVSLATRRMMIPQGPNVLIVVADALRADHLGCYGYPKPTSPNIDQFAQEGLVFEKATTIAPWTKPAIASLFTSLYPHQHGALYMLDRLENSCLTLAEVFRNENDSAQGINFIPYLKADQDPPGRELFFEGILFEAEKKDILKDGWKLIENTGEKNPDAFDGLGPLAKYVPPDQKRATSSTGRMKILPSKTIWPGARPASSMF